MKILFLNVFLNLKRNLFFALGFFLLLTTKASAHPLDVGFLSIENQQNELNIKFEVNPRIGCEVLKLAEDCRLAPAASFFEGHAVALFAATLEPQFISVNGEICTWQPSPQLKFESSTVLALTATAECKSLNGQLLWDFPFLQRLGPTFSLIGKIKISGQERVLGIDIEKHQLDISLQNPDSDFAHFVMMGLEHIGLHKDEWVGPEGIHWPAGIDHILFVVGLILASAHLIGIIKTVTGFTVGHSITLTLASFQLLHVPSQVTEVAIAMSIAFVAAESLWLKKLKSQWRLSLLFGLIHGLGFASAIRELNLDTGNLLKALLGFNVGVEFGQVLIVLAVFPIVKFVLNFNTGKKYVIPAVAFCIFSAGVYWVVQRIFWFQG